jgi:pimeloyl-ACP methyl ester carboxylesterase
VATFGLLHGAWHEPSCWTSLIESLESRGHRAVAPDLPLHDPAATYEDRVRPVIEALDGAEGPVVVVAHSQSSALGPLVVVARPVSLLVYLCPRMGGLAPPPDAPAPFRESLEFPPDNPDGTTAWDPEVAIEMLYPRLAPESARALAARMRAMAMPADDYPLRNHPDVPTALVLAGEDEFFEPAFERFMAREALGIEPIELPGGHFPMVEEPDRLATLLDRLAASRS